MKKNFRNILKYTLSLVLAAVLLWFCFRSQLAGFPGEPERLPLGMGDAEHIGRGAVQLVQGGALA